MGLNLRQFKIPFRGQIFWSGMRESNPRLQLGRLAYYHYTNPAYKPNTDGILTKFYRIINCLGLSTINLIGVDS
jgi:hypothetical protein